LEESFKKVLEEEFFFIKSNDIIDFFILVNNSKMTIKKEVIIIFILTLVMKTEKQSKNGSMFPRLPNLHKRVYVDFYMRKSYDYKDNKQ
jgi:hypothetical protein